MQSDQVLAKNFGEACGDDHVIMLLNNVSIDYYRVLLVKLITSFMTGWNSKGMQACLSRLKGIDSTGPLLNVLETFSTFCRCAGTLLQVAAVPTSVSAVEYFAAYKGPGIFEKAIQSILTREVDSQGRKVKSTVDSREMIQKMYKDVMRTAASTRVQQPQFDAILSALKEDEPKMTVLKEAWEKMPSFRSGLREGSCDPLEKQLFKVAKEKAEGLVTAASGNAGGKSPKISSKDLNILLCVLKEFQKEAGAMDLTTNLMKWAKTHNDTLARTEFEQIMLKFIEDNDKWTGKRGKFIPLDVGEIKDAVQKRGGKLHEDLVPVVQTSVYVYLRAAQDHVSLTAFIFRSELPPSLPYTNCFHWNHHCY